jgi:nitrile hydratase
LKGIIKNPMAALKFSSYTSAPDNLFKIGDGVEIRQSIALGHRRTPAYIRGKHGVIERICGLFLNPEELAYGFNGLPKKILYRVAFKQVDVWLDYQGPVNDTLEIEIFEHWLKPN